VVKVNCQRREICESLGGFGNCACRHENEDIKFLEYDEVNSYERNLLY
jgi:hypothetical protein